MLEALLTPEAILADAWRRLSAAVRERNAPFRLASVAIADEIAGVTVRTVVLRRVDPQQRVLMFHTDRRSPKFASLQLDGATAWVFYDHGLGLQLRVQSTATLHTTDAIAHEQWNAAPEATRLVYRTALAPGTPVPTADAALQPPALDGRDHFAVVRCTVESFDWLYLHPAGHRRMRFNFAGGQVASTWLAP